MIRPTPTETLATNLKALMEEKKIESNRELARLSGVSDRMIGLILSQPVKATVDIIDKLAKPFGLTNWQLIMPSLHTDLIKSGKLTKLIDNYSHASFEGREYIDRIAEKEAHYK